MVFKTANSTCCSFVVVPCEPPVVQDHDFSLFGSLLATILHFFIIKHYNKDKKMMLFNIAPTGNQF